MVTGISEQNRLFSFDSPLGSSLLCNAFSGTEAISEMFHFKLELVSEDFNINWKALLNKNVTVGIRLSDGSFRYFNGYIIRFEPAKHEGRLGYYNAEMVPWLWFLTQTQNCKVYQEMTIVEVIEETFDIAGFSDYDTSRLGDRHAPWINCCQYRETAFDFISRLAEIEGVYYYFKHEQGKHTLIMVDHLSAHLPLPFQPSIQYAHDEGGGVYRGDDTITDCNMSKVVKPSKYAHKDYNFLIPNAPLYHEGDVHKEVAGDRELEIFDYPGEFEWPKDAPDWGTLRQQELEYDHAVLTGSGTVRAMAPGYRFDLLNSPRADLDGNYLITSVTHQAHEGSFGAGFDAGPASYNNIFSAIPSSVQFRPTRKTEGPDVSSIQTATVVGPPGEEIYTDEYGRVKVHFHWDREAPDEDSSCWIRVAQPWAGPNWGHIWIPRVGMEVMIQFLEGDPDRPVITGCLYNEENRPPYKLPDRKNWSGIMTRTTKGGKTTDFNELRFDDTQGSELYLLHAQKDMQFTVNNDTVESIKRDRTLNVKRNQIEQVEADKHGTVKGNHNEKIGGNLSQTVGGNIAVDAGGDIVLNAQGNICIIAGGVINLTAGQGIVISGGSGGMGGLGGGLSGLAGGALSGMAGGLPGAMPGLPSGVPGVPSSVTGAMSGATGAMSGVMSGVTGAMSGATGAMSGAMSGATGAMSGVTGAMSGVTSGVTGAMSGVTGAMSGATGAMSGITSAGSGLKSEAARLSGAPSGLAGATGGGLPGGVSGQISNAVSSAVNSAMAGATGGVGGGLPINPAALGSQITNAILSSGGLGGGLGSGLPGSLGGGLPLSPAAAGQLRSLVTNLLTSAAAGGAGGSGGGLPIDPATLSSQISSALQSYLSSSGAGAPGGVPGGLGGVAGALSGGAPGGLPGVPGGLGGVASALGGGAPGSVTDALTGGGLGGGLGDAAGALSGGGLGGGLGDVAGGLSGGGLGGGLGDAAGGLSGGGLGGGLGDAAGGLSGGGLGSVAGGLAGGTGGVAGALGGGGTGGVASALTGGGLPGGPGGGLPGAGSCFISVNSSGIVLQGSPNIWLNCGLPAPAGTCTHTPVTPMLPDLSHLAGTTNLGGAANPKIKAQAAPPTTGGSPGGSGGSRGSGGSGGPGGSGTGPGGTGGGTSGGGGGGSDVAADIMDAIEGDTSDEMSAELDDALEGSMASGLASNPWVNPSSLGGLAALNPASIVQGLLQSLPNVSMPSVNVPSVQTVLNMVSQAANPSTPGASTPSGPPAPGAVSQPPDEPNFAPDEQPEAEDEDEDSDSGLEFI